MKMLSEQKDEGMRGVQLALEGNNYFRRMRENEETEYEIEMKMLIEMHI
jgi:hypothetical protein